MLLRIVPKPLVFMIFGTLGSVFGAAEGEVTPPEGH